MTLVWILVSGLAMSALALVGAATLAMRPESLRRILLPLVAFAAGSLLGGAVFHMIPAAVDELGNRTAVWAWLLAGFVLFFVLEQFLHWHHCHGSISDHKEPVTYLILVADGLHNLIGGLSVGAAFVVDVRLGATAWLAAAAHEVPQEMGDFGILVKGGWSRSRALTFNLLSALPFPLGGVLAWAFAEDLEVAVLIPFAAGNFVYIAAADLIPEVKKSDHLRTAALHLASFALGIALLFLLRVVFQHQNA